MEHCAADGGWLRSLLEADKPGRSFGAAAWANCGQVEWYPAVADLALSGDLGFTAGPWTCSPAGRRTPIQGHYLTIWKRDAGCDWRVQFDAGVSSPPAAEAESRVSSGEAPSGQANPPSQPGADAAVSQAITDFQSSAAQDGIAAGLRTYARTGDFLFYGDQMAPAPMGLADANLFFTAHPILGTCEEGSRIRSADGTLAYCGGVFTDVKRRSGHAYAQIWQYEPRVANWGLRVLLINSL